MNNIKITLWEFPNLIRTIAKNFNDYEFTEQKVGKDYISFSSSLPSVMTERDFLSLTLLEGNQYRVEEELVEDTILELFMYIYDTFNTTDRIYYSLSGKKEYTNNPTDILHTINKLKGVKVYIRCDKSDYTFEINIHHTTDVVPIDDIEDSFLSGINPKEFKTKEVEEAYNSFLEELDRFEEDVVINDDLKQAFKDYDTFKQEEGQKFDDGKLPLFTVLFKQFPNALKEVVRCSNSGHNKYPNDTDWMNFKRVDLSKNPDRYLNAGTRHLMESEGELLWNEDMEEYGGALHLAQAVWNILAHLERKLENEK